MGTRFAKGGHSPTSPTLGLERSSKKKNFLNRLAILSRDNLSLSWLLLAASAEPEVASWGQGRGRAGLVDRLPVHTEAIDAGVLRVAPVAQNP